MARRLSNQALKETLTRLQQLKDKREQINGEIEMYKDALCGHLEAINADELTQFGWVISNKEVTTAKIDSKALRAELPEVAARYTVTASGKRFTVRAVA